MRYKMFGSELLMLELINSTTSTVSAGATGSGPNRGLKFVSWSDPIPGDAEAVVLNVTEVSGTSESLLTVFPSGTGRPTASNLNFPAKTVIPNLVTVTLGEGGAVNIYNALGTVNVIADVEGYFTPQLSSNMTGEFHPITPLRVCDTRVGSALSACSGRGALGAGRTTLVNVSGVGAGAVPGDGTAQTVVLNLTGVAPSASTYNVSFLVGPHEVVMPDLAGEHDLSGESEGVRQRLPLSTVRTLTHERTDPHHVPWHQGDGFQQNVETFLPLHPADEEDAQGSSHTTFRF